MTEYRPKRIAILGGSFNPVHIGHMILADYIAQFTDVDAVWLMLSPLNPLKAADTALADDSHRLEMLRIATRHTSRIAPCGIELSMPRPSYTINSLRELAELHPETEFRLLIGSDNWQIFDRWYRHADIIREFSPIIYPRPGYFTDPQSLPAGVTPVNAPTVDLSSTFVRQSIAEGKDMTLFLPPGVAEYIHNNHLYNSICNPTENCQPIP